MLQLQNIGNNINIPVQQYYCESEEEISQIPSNAPVGSTVAILTEKGLEVKMKHSDGTWKSI